MGWIQVLSPRLNFDSNVFINCPFDEEYRPLLRALLFTIIDLGFTPRIALEEIDSGASRLDKIVRLIESSRYAIHDLSRLRADTAGEYYRLNMPFELGLDMGCRLFGGRSRRTKRCLILESEPYRYQAALSDVAGSDIAAHGGNRTNLVFHVRSWLVNQTGIEAPGPDQLLSRLLEFDMAHEKTLTAQGFSRREIDRFPVGELIRHLLRWLRSNKPPKQFGRSEVQ